MNKPTMMTALATIAAAATLLPSCELDSCTDLGCGPAFDLHLDKGIFAGGNYEMVVTADGVTTTCAVTLPFTSCTNGVSCDQPDPGFIIERDDCGGTLERIEGILFHRAPEQIDVEVRKDGTVLGSGSYQPAYTVSNPNGPDCAPTCKQTQGPVELDLDWEQI